MKKITVAFDDLKFSEETMKYAIALASGSKALLSGVFLDDFLYHSYPAFDTLESVGFQGLEIDQLRDQEENIRQQSITTFDTACKSEQLNYTIHHGKSFALDELLKESIYSDLLIIGACETFSHYKELVPSAFIRHLLAAVRCPVLVVPDKYRTAESIVLLYDGKPSSVFAIKMFNYMMPWMRKLKTEVITVRNPKDAPEFPDDPLIREFIKCNYPDAKYTLLQGDPEEKIPGYLKAYSPNSMVVLGAYERNQVSRWLKTSMADILINELAAPVFIAHEK
jgi:nucleotide-binding universal stress UspA family protein